MIYYVIYLSAIYKVLTYIKPRLESDWESLVFVQLPASNLGERPPETSCKEKGSNGPISE